MSTQAALGFDPAAGEKAKEKGMRVSAEARKELLTKVRIGLTQLWEADNKGVTADDAQAWLIHHGYPASALGNAAGSLFKGSEWECVGRKNSTRVSNHRREIRVWRLR